MEGMLGLIVIMVIGGGILFGLPYLVKLFVRFPKVNELSESQRREIVDEMIRSNSNNTKLHSASEGRGFGTKFIRISKFDIEGDEISIYAKVLIIFYLPMPIMLGFVVCNIMDKVLATLTNEDFKRIKNDVKHRYF